MSWGRLALAAIVTIVLLLPFGQSIADLAEPIPEPLRTIVLVAVFLALLVAVDRLLVWVARRIRPRDEGGDSESRLDR